MSGGRTDIRTGMPISKQQDEVHMERRSYMERSASAAANLLFELKTPEGKQLTGLIVSTLADRISTLIADDAECKTLVGILASIGHNVRFGKLAADKLAADNFITGQDD